MLRHILLATASCVALAVPAHAAFKPPSGQIDPTTLVGTTPLSTTAAQAASAIQPDANGNVTAPVRLGAAGSVMVDAAAAMTDAQVPQGTTCASPAAVAAGNIAVAGQACFHSRFPAVPWTQFQINGESDQGGSTAYNVQLGVVGLATSGAGGFWNMNPVLTLQTGSNGGTNMEADLNNFACDSGTFGAGTSYGGSTGCTAVSHGLWVTGSSKYPATSYINFASGQGLQAHAGIQAIGPILEDFLLFERTGSAVGIDLEGAHVTDIDLHSSSCTKDCVFLGVNQKLGWTSDATHYATPASYQASAVELGNITFDQNGVLQVYSGLSTGGENVTGALGVSGAVTANSLTIGSGASTVAGNVTLSGVVKTTQSLIAQGGIGATGVSTTMNGILVFGPNTFPVLAAVTVANLPAGCGLGGEAIATDGRKPGEAAGAGSGVPVTCLQTTKGGTTAWYSMFSGAPVTN